LIEASNFLDGRSFCRLFQSRDQQTIAHEGGFVKEPLWSGLGVSFLRTSVSIDFLKYFERRRLEFEDISAIAHRVLRIQQLHSFQNGECEKP
jgi:hypothetical protein